MDLKLIPRITYYMQNTFDSTKKLKLEELVQIIIIVIMIHLELSLGLMLQIRLAYMNT